MKTNYLKVFSRESDFEDYKQLMVDTARNKLDGVSQKQANDKIREYQFKLMGVDENCSKRELKKAIRRNRLDIFDMIEETLINLTETGWGDNPFFDMFVERKSANLGDTNEFYVEDNSILTVEKFSGGHHNLYRQKLGIGQYFMVETNAYAVKIYEEYELFATGKTDWAKFILKIYEAFDEYTNTMIANAVQGVATSIPNPDIFSKSGVLGPATQAAFDELVASVEAANRDEVCIIGTKVALKKLEAMVDVDWASERYKETRETLGHIGYYGSTPVLEIPQRFASNDFSQKLVNDNLLFIISKNNKFVKLFDEGADEIYEITDPIVNRDKTVEYEYVKRMGLGVVIAEQFGLWTITQ